MNVDRFTFPFFFLFHVVSFSFSPHTSPFASCFWTTWVDPLQRYFHTHGVVFLIALCVPLLSPTFRPVTALTGSGAGRDDSRACFSLWVYYLCSGPFKTTQNDPGSQCGEFALTSCLPLLIFLLLLLLLLPCSFLLSLQLWESVEDCGSVGTACFLVRLLFPLDLASRRHLTLSLTLPLLGILVYIAWARAWVLYCLTSVLYLSVAELNIPPMSWEIACLIDPYPPCYVAW